MNNTEAAIRAIGEGVEVKRACWMDDLAVHWREAAGCFIDRWAERVNVMQADDWEVVEAEDKERGYICTHCGKDLGPDPDRCPVCEPEPEPEAEYEERRIYPSARTGRLVIVDPVEGPVPISDLMSHPNFAGFVYKFSDGTIRYSFRSGMYADGACTHETCEPSLLTESGWEVLRPKAVLFEKEK